MKSKSSNTTKAFFEWFSVLAIVSLAVPTSFFWLFGYEELSFWTLFISVPVGLLISIVVVSIGLFLNYFFKKDDN